MTWSVILVGGLSLLLAAFLTGMPIFVAFLAINTAGIMVVFGDRGFGLIANSIFDSGSIVALSAIPLFILMGELLNRSGSVDLLFRSMDKLVGRVPGRQYVLTIILSVIFGALSGAAMAVAAMMSRSLYPTMIARGYDPKLSMGAILAGASLAPIIPPSVLVIVIATLADISVAKLLIAGIVPGLVLAGAFLAYISIRVSFDPALAPEEPGPRVKVTMIEKLVAIGQMLPFSIIIFLVIGLILLGIATPTESAATGVVGAMIVSAINRRFNLKIAYEALGSAAFITSMIIVIVASSNMFGQLLAITGSTGQLVKYVSNLTADPNLLLFLMMLIIFVLCMFIDQIAIMLIIVPIVKPIVAALGFDPIWFWTLVLINLTVGGITPPFGYTMFAFKGGAPEVPLSSIFSSVWPFVLLFVAVGVLIVFFPSIATFLPGKL
jgi:tripartite ATP-independent transporter DctM subunit